LITLDKPVIQALPLSKSLCEIAQSVSVDILRLDQIHPLVSGNKWYKLKHNLDAATKQGHQRLLSCGGPHSNHLHALASAGKAFGFETTGFVRGYENIPLTDTLLDCQSMGMTLIFIDKKTYLKRYDPLWCQEQAETYDSYWIPEGGNNDLGRMGCIEIAEQCLGYDEVWTSIGSGCTFTGIAQALSSGVALKGVMAIKGGEALASSLLVNTNSKNSIDCDSHLGGFGRCPEKLIDLINYYDSHNLPLDPVYTGKLVMAFEQSLQAGEIDSHKRYLLIHSGGLQGRRGIKALSLIP
jgi:1-aminocyclopropane-1-carboxylate deaminase